MGVSGPWSRRWRARLRASLLTAAALTLVAALAVLSERYRLGADWTAVGRNTLGERSLSLLASLDHEVDVTVFTGEDRLPRAAATELLERYRRAYPRLRFRFVDPAREPELAREYGAERPDTLQREQFHKQ